MIPASTLMQEAARYSRTLSVRADIYRGSTLLQSMAPVTGGTVTADRTNKARLTAKISLAMYPWEAVGIDEHRCRVVLSRGIESLGYAERTPLGMYRVDTVSRNAFGQIDLDCSGREQYVVDARFIRPRTPSYGASTVGEIRNLIREVLPSARIRLQNTSDRLVTATAPWAQERWDGVDALSTSIHAETFCDYTGDFVIADTPDLSNGVPVYSVNEGDGGVLVTREEKGTRDQVYNAVSASGSSSDPNVPPVWGWAYDSDPNSETYYFADPDGPGGGFGPVPRFYTSQFLTTDQQCADTAQSLLAQSLAANNTLTFSTLPLEFLEVGDFVQVNMLDGTTEVHLLNKITLGLDINAAMTCDTLSSKTEARVLL